MVIFYMVLVPMESIMLPSKSAGKKSHKALRRGASALPACWKGIDQHLSEVQMSCTHRMS